MLAENVCPRLLDSARTGSILKRVRRAAEKLMTDELFNDLTQRQVRILKECIFKINARLREFDAH